jgi:hypothetical protein
MVKRNFLAKAALIAPVVLAVQTASAGSLQRLDANHVAVRASNVAVGQLLGELDGLMRLDNLFLEPAIEKKVVSVSIDRVALADAAVQILKESGLDFIVWGRRIFVGDPTAAVQLARQGSGSGAGAAAPEPVDTASAPTPVELAGASDTVTTDEYSMVGENVTYHDPNFVTYKMRPDVVRRRQNVDVSKIP